MASHDSSCVLWLQFDEPSAPTVYDQSGYNNNGTIYGATFDFSPFNRALRFDGVDDYVSIPHSSSLDLRTQLTISAWVYRTRPTFEWLVNKNYDSAANTQYGVAVSDTHTIQFFLEGSVRVSFTVNTIGTWAHIVCSWNGSTAMIYVNGILRASASFSGTLTSRPYALTLACRKTTGGVPGHLYFQGSMDEVRIFNRALSALEIAQMYHDYIKHKRI